MRRSAFAAAMLLAALAIATGGCGGEAGSATGTAEPATTRATTAGASGAAAGRAVFLGASGCGGCHTLGDAGSEGTLASNLDEKKPSEARVLEVVANGTGAMPSYGRTLTESQIADVAVYVSSVAGR